MNTHEIQSEKSGRNCQYLVVDQLPSHFRSYNVDKVFVRGLFFDESLALSQYIGNMVTPNYTQLKAIYSDVIRGIEIDELEIVDFIVLVIISSIYTIDDFGWSPNVRCCHHDDEGNACSGIINDKILLDDFDFVDPAPLVQSLPIPLKIDGVDIDVVPITVGGMVAKEAYQEEHPEVNKKLVNLASIIKSTDYPSLDDKINFIKFCRSKDLKDLQMIDSEIHIKLNPIEKKCPVCKKVNKLNIGLTKIRSYP